MNEKELLEKICPTQQERDKVNELVKEYTDVLEKRIKEKGIHAEVCLTGSMAKDTWISGDRNIDLFLIFSHDYSEQQLKRYGLDIGKISEYEIAYAEHPYVRNYVNGYEIDVVPAYRFREGIRSSVDRTPLHTEYVKTHLKDRNQVRLLKKFVRSIGVYGSDLKVQGFSGYLCELLVIRYGSFMNVLEAAADWKKGDPLFLEDFTQHFDEPLIFVDPVDPERNVAAVLSEENLTKFIYSSREFLRNPDPSYFFKEPERYTRILNTQLYRIDFTVNLIDDILFPQLRKTRDFLVKELERNDFQVFNTAIFYSGILLELSVFELPPLTNHLGPPIWEREHCERFLKKHERIGVHRDKLCAIVTRKHATAEDLLKTLLISRKGFGKDLAKAEAHVNRIPGDIDVLIY
ncbi:MAG: CCA tRNA nucleotidyltransferase [Theionarchaea archaeon]|nr:CCA tRNA nucleotidyltransferase [Theionarchaea archaeon]